MDLINELITHILMTKFEDLPREVVCTAKRFLLDSLGVLIAGSSAPGCQEVVTKIKEWGGRPEATILIYGGKVPSPNAALVNSMMMHSRDFDDTHDLSSVHAFASALPAAMACSEEAGGVDGRHFLVALVLGTDVTCRIGLGMKLYKGWHYSAVCGTFGAVAAAGKILNLSHEEMLNAMGIVLSLTSGNVQCVRDKALVKRMQPGFAAQSALSGIAYAKRGITGARGVLEGDYGFFSLYDDKGENKGYERFREEGEYGIHELTRGLGRQFEITRLSMKPYPCCRYTHPAIDGALEFVRSQEMKADEVDEVKVYVPKLIYDVVGKPFELDDSGPQQVKAQFSIPYTLALTLVKGAKPDIGDFEDKNIRGRSDVLKMARQIKVEVDPKLLGRVPLKLVFQTKKDIYSVIIDYLKGSPDTPMTDEECREKFLRCADYSFRPIPETRFELIIDAIESLEEIDDIRKLIFLLS